MCQGAGIGNHWGMPDDELLERVRELRARGRSPKEIARALKVRPATVTPLIRRLAAAEPREKEAPLKAAGHLGEWDGVCDLEFGRDGMPMYIEGPHDDTWRIMHTLRQNVGDGNFHYLAGLRP